jgi:hypothetical protein
MLELKPAVRKWIYGIIAASVPLLISIGTISGELGQQILNVAAAVLAIGGSVLAINHVPDEE